jgi:hypothetical protein
MNENRQRASRRRVPVKRPDGAQASSHPHVTDQRGEAAARLPLNKQSRLGAGQRRQLHSLVRPHCSILCCCFCEVLPLRIW